MTYRNRDEFSLATRQRRPISAINSVMLVASRDIVVTSTFTFTVTFYASTVGGGVILEPTNLKVVDNCMQPSWRHV